MQQNFSTLRKILWTAVGAAVLLLFALVIWIDQDVHEPTEQVVSEVIQPRFDLVSHTGAAVSDETFRGDWLLVFFGFTNCPDICPTTLAEMAAVMEELGEDAEDVQPLFVSVDPERDDPEAMAEYVGAFHPSIVGLTGEQDAIVRAAENFRAYHEKVPAEDGDGYSVAHSSVTYLVSPDGRFARIYSYGTPADEIVDDLRQRL